jgi:hypothetical protein
MHFLEAETYVGVLNVLKKPNFGFLNKVHLVGDQTLITVMNVCVTVMGGYRQVRDY